MPTSRVMTWNSNGGAAPRGAAIANAAAALNVLYPPRQTPLQVVVCQETAVAPDSPALHWLLSRAKTPRLPASLRMTWYRAG